LPLSLALALAYNAALKGSLFRRTPA